MINTHTKTNNNSFNFKRYIFFTICILLVFFSFIIRMIKWQIIDYEKYKNLANRSNIYFMKTDPVRGEILDVNGEGLAVNDTGYKVVIDRLLVKNKEENNLILDTIKLLEKLNSSWIDILPIYTDLKTKTYCYKENNESQIKTLINTLEISKNSTADECIKSMISRYKIENIEDAEDLRIVCSVKYNMEKCLGLNFKSTPYVLADSISKDAVVVISEKLDSLQGLRIQSSQTRKYINGKVAPHIVGYTGFMSSKEYEKRKNDYPMDAKIGKTGAESAFEDFLKGTGGKKMVEMSKYGEVLNISEKEPSSAGKTIYLTISSKIQKVANESLKRNVEAAKNSGIKDCTSAAVVVLNVNDFSILAASTYPSYDLTRFVEDKSYYSDLVNDKTKPLLNRAFSGAYAPGSIYKPMIACAALQEEKITPNDTICCAGSFNYYRGYKLRCMGVHGHLKLANALAKSCNVYFAELGRRLGIENISKWAKKFGIGVKTGVELGESSGILAGPEHSKDVAAKWYESGSSQAAIGQSDNMFTPLQLATYTATIANGGNRFKTHILDKITDYSRTKIIKKFEPELIENVGVSEENLQAVKEGMRQVVLSGTARDFAKYPISIGAKTGTAQNAGTDHTTFICFAPFDKPEIAISVVIEHGKSGMASKNVARDILNAYFGIEK